MQARCHWCRNTLSVNEQIPNGSVPDVVLPFKLTKDMAKAEIENFVGKRKFFAHPQFTKEFTTQNVMGVYLPYMVVDINGHSRLSGQGEHLARRYTRGSGNNKRTYYDADLYNVDREFDILVDDLTVESSQDKLNNHSSNKTNNVINAIMPFDMENSVKWNANYLKGYTSEKRDTNIEELQDLVDTQAKDIARYKANETLKAYDRGVCWTSEQLSIKGAQWKSAYLPVWLYSYQQVISNDKKVLHYVAVNARTKETMGSVPIHMPKLLGVSALVEIIGIFLSMVVDFEYSGLFALSGFLYFMFYYFKYRNSNARHVHEKETKSTMENIQKEDIFVEKRRGLSNPRMSGANNTKVSNQGISGTMFNIVNDSIPDSIKKHMN